MPTPIGHSLAGLLLSKTKIFVPSRSTYKSFAVAMILANLADADFVPGLLSGNPNRFHHGLTHSVGASFIVGFLFAWYFYFRQGRFLAPFFFAASAYSSHILLDFFTVDTSLPHGIPMFWPISSEYFISPIAAFLDVRRSASMGTFFQSLFVAHNGWTVLREIIILVPMVLIVQIGKYFKNRTFQPNI